MPAASRDRLAGLGARERDGDGRGALAQVVERDGGVDLAGDALVPARSGGRRRRSSSSSGPSSGPTRLRCWTCRNRSRRRRVAPGRGSSRHSVRLRGGLGEPLGRAGRHEDPELPAQRVLLRRRPVGVEQVALEQDGVGDRGDRVERVRAPEIRAGHDVDLPASSSSASNVCSQVGQRPRRAPGGEPGQGVLGQPQPRGAAVVGGHHVASTRATGSRNVGLRVPRDEPDLHPAAGDS